MAQWVRVLVAVPWWLGVHIPEKRTNSSLLPSDLQVTHTCVSTSIYTQNVINFFFSWKAQNFPALSNNVKGQHVTLLLRAIKFVTQKSSILLFLLSNTLYQHTFKLQFHYLYWRLHVFQIDWQWSVTLWTHEKVFNKIFFFLEESSVRYSSSSYIGWDGILLNTCSFAELQPSTICPLSMCVSSFHVLSTILALSYSLSTYRCLTEGGNLLVP